MSDEEPKVEEVAAEEPTKTAEETKKEEFEARVNEFIKSYGELVSRLKIDFASYPMFVPDGQGGFKIICQNTPVDIDNQPIRSPFIPE